MKINIIKRDGEYAVEFWQGCQGFTLEYRASKKECQWMKKQLAKAFKSFADETKKVSP